MKYSELLQLFFERSNEIVNYWTIYIVGMASVLGYFAVRTDLDRKAKLTFSIGFMFLSALNLVGLLDVNNQREAVLEVIRGSHADALADSSVRTTNLLLQKLVEPTFDPFEQWQVIAIHACIDAITIFGIWTIGPGKAKRASAAPAKDHKS
jgi:hypothetical protein